MAQTLQVTARVFDEAAVSKQILRDAEREAAYAAVSGGFGIVWIDCKLEGTRCAAELTPNDVDVLIRTQRRRLNAGEQAPETAHALLNASSRGVYATVYYDQVARVAHETPGGQTGVLLGYAMAHEIGHLLGLAHSLQGIMKARWGLHDFELMAKRQLRFDETEFRQVQVELASRSDAMFARTLH